MVTSIQELPPVALAQGTNFYTLFKSPSESANEKNTKDSSKVADKGNTKTDNVKNNNTPEEEKKKVSDFGVIERKLDELLDDKNLYLQLSFDKEINKMIIKIMDSNTKEVVHQYPPEVSLKIAKSITSMLDTGQVTDARV